MPGELIDYGSKALKPLENYISNYLKVWDNLKICKSLKASTR